jgi:hypothetical protein
MYAGDAVFHGGGKTAQGGCVGKSNNQEINKQEKGSER